MKNSNVVVKGTNIYYQKHTVVKGTNIYYQKHTVVTINYWLFVVVQMQTILQP